MPQRRSRRFPFPLSDGRSIRIITLIFLSVIGARGQSVRADEDAPTAIRAREVELHYRLLEGNPLGVIELWYTRDRGATWQRYARDEDRISPVVFVAPAEGLYGFILNCVGTGSAESSRPAPYTPPQRWVFIDYTPPLLQWEAVEPLESVGSVNRLQLRWTAYDDNLPGRPVALAYQTSLDQTWHVIASALPNLGRYDWVLPADLSGQVTLRLTVHDLGGHIVERLHGPVPSQRWLAPASRPAPLVIPATQPQVATTRPAIDPLASIGAPLDAVLLKKADELYQQASWHLVRGQYAIAAERLREALDINPDLLPAMSDLAGIHATQQDYDKAIQLYTTVLGKDPRNVQALRGAALAYAVRKQYPAARDVLKRIVGVNASDAEAWLDLGDVTFMMGDATEARAHWGRAATMTGAPEVISRKARSRLASLGTADAHQAR